MARYHVSGEGGGKLISAWHTCILLYKMHSASYNYCLLYPENTIKERKKKKVLSLKENFSQHPVAKGGLVEPPF